MASDCKRHRWVLESESWMNLAKPNGSFSLWFKLREFRICSICGLKDNRWKPGGETKTVEGAALDILKRKSLAKGKTDE